VDFDRVVPMHLYYKKNNMSTDMENGRGNKRARVTRRSRNPKLVDSTTFFVIKITINDDGIIHVYVWEYPVPVR
jgi:hypothetical protein